MINQVDSSIMDIVESGFGTGQAGTPQSMVGGVSDDRGGWKAMQDFYRQSMRDPYQDPAVQAEIKRREEINRPDIPSSLSPDRSGMYASGDDPFTVDLRAATPYAPIASKGTRVRENINDKGDPESRGEYDWNSPWSALMMAGLNIAAGESPDALTNISQGALGGVQDVMGRRVQERELKATEDLRKAQMDQARASLIRNQLDRPMKFEEYVDLHYPATERNTHDEGQRRRKIAELMTQYELYKSSIGRGYQILTGGDGISAAHSLDLESGGIVSG